MPTAALALALAAEAAQIRVRLVGQADLGPLLGRAAHHGRSKASPEVAAKRGNPNAAEQAARRAARRATRKAAK